MVFSLSLSSHYHSLLASRLFLWLSLSHISVTLVFYFCLRFAVNTTPLHEQHLSSATSSLLLSHEWKTIYSGEKISSTASKWDTGGAIPFHEGGSEGTLGMKTTKTCASSYAFFFCAFHHEPLKRVQQYSNIFLKGCRESSQNRDRGWGASQSAITQ